MRTYVAIVAVTTFAQALIWGVNTLFLLDAGLDIFGVMVANAAFAAGQVLFEVPTGVVADTVGRRASYLLCIAILFVATLLYVWLGATMPDFCLRAWLHAAGSRVHLLQWRRGGLDGRRPRLEGYEGKMDVVFARGGMTQGAAMLVRRGHRRVPWPARPCGSVRGARRDARSGRIDRRLPHARSRVHAAELSPFAPRRGDANHRLRRRQVRLGDSVVRPLMLAGLIHGVFFMYGFYSWQVYFLDLLGRELVWVNGVIAALGGALRDRRAARWWRRSAVCSEAVDRVRHGALQGVAIVIAAVLQVFWLAVPLYLVATLAFGVQRRCGKRG